MFVKAFDRGLYNNMWTFCDVYILLLFVFQQGWASLINYIQERSTLIGLKGIGQKLHIGFFQRFYLWGDSL